MDEMYFLQLPVIHPNLLRHIPVHHPPHGYASGYLTKKLNGALHQARLMKKNTGIDSLLVKWCQ
jgi:hypothetical protein